MGGASLGCLLTVLHAGTAKAQAAAPAAPAAPATGRVEEVVVTAQRRSENLQNTPVAVTALTSASLATRQLNKVENLSSSVPSLLIQQVTASPSAIAIDMRGDAELSGGLITSESPVALYIDDVYQSRLSAANIELGDLERIEVLRGPQGTLYGRNSMTGAIKFITRQPDGSEWLNGELGYGSFGDKRAQFSVGTPIGPHLGLAVSGLFTDTDGWQHDTTLDRTVGKMTNEALRASLGLVDTGPFTAVLRAGYVHTYGDGQYFTPTNPDTGAPLLPYGDTASPYPSAAHLVETSQSLTLGYRIGQLTLRSITALAQTSDYWTLDFSGGFNPFPGAPTEAGFDRDNVAHQHQITQEFQAVGDAFEGRLHYIGGLFFFDESAHEAITDTFGADTVAPYPVSLLPTSFTTTSRSYAAYGQADFKVTDKLTLTGGLRYTDDQKHFNGAIQNGFAFPFVYGSDVTKLSDNVWTPKFTAQYQVSDTLLTYATISRGYRAGGFNGLAVASTSVFGLPYQPETAWSYEAGAKMEFWDRRARLNAAFYYEQLDNLQQTVITSGGSAQTENAAQAHVYGLELEGTVTPVKDLTLFSNLTLTNDGYDELNPDTSAAQAHATQLPLVSHVQAQVGGTWRITPEVLRGGAFILASDFAYRSSHYSDAAETVVGFIQPSERLNASVTWQLAGGHWSVTAAGKNLTDEHHYYDGIALIPGLFGGKLPLEPISGMLTLKYVY